MILWCKTHSIDLSSIPKKSAQVTTMCVLAAFEHAIPFNDVHHLEDGIPLTVDGSEIRLSSWGW